MNEQRSHRGAPRPTPPQDLEAALAEVERLQDQLDTLRQEMVWSNRLTTLGTLSAVLAHEYNNLLTPIASYAQLALKQPGDPQLTDKALRTAVQGVHQAARLAEATLGFARPDDRPDPAWATLPRAAEAALACLGRPLEQDGITLTIQAPDDPLRIEPLALQQVLVNLFTNARRAMLGSAGPRRLSLAARREQDGVRVEVTDTGPGIPNAVLARAFEPFVSSDPQGTTNPPSTEPTRGTGLGLSICRDLVQAAGGRISVSNGEQGARVGFWLPLA